MLSIIFMTFPKPTCFEPSASSRRPMPGCESRALLLACAPAARRTERARARTDAAFACSWTKLALALGSVFLNSSRLSSSFNTLIVSARATSSSALVAFTSSHSLVLVSQPVFSWAKNCVSSDRESFVSFKSALMLAISTPSSPMRLLSASIWTVSKATSFFFAPMRASWVLIADPSAATASSRPLDISSLSCCSMPVISPLLGT
mmetsp:Transcript_117899/g.313667  ORF Transcript_117899/g.313667 Transcript_117899/m.313667 type:complete len:205 (-) Transcript_117899:464-1078(-)